MHLPHDGKCSPSISDASANLTERMMSEPRRRARLLFEQGRETVRQVRSPQGPDRPPGGFVALSCNVGNGLADPGRLTDYLIRSNADVVGIQELADSQAAFIERDLGLAFPYRLLFPGGFAGKGILSTKPIQESGVVAFAPERPDLSATVLVDGRPVARDRRPSAPSAAFPWWIALRCGDRKPGQTGGGAGDQQQSGRRPLRSQHDLVATSVFAAAGRRSSRSVPVRGSMVGHVSCPGRQYPPIRFDS